jgi:hypothetical protein
MVDPSQLEVTVARSGDLETLLDFFDRTAYEPEQVGDRTLVLTSPGEIGEQLARREVDVYLRLIERLYPGVAASVVD